MAGGLPGATFPVTPAVSLQPIGDESQARVLHVVGDKPGGPHSGLGPQARGRGSWGLRLRWCLENSGCCGRWLHLPAPTGLGGVGPWGNSQFLFSGSPHLIGPSHPVSFGCVSMCMSVRLSLSLAPLLWPVSHGLFLLALCVAPPPLSDSLSFPPRVSFSFCLSSTPFLPLPSPPCLHLSPSSFVFVSLSLLFLLSLCPFSLYLCLPLLFLPFLCLLLVLPAVSKSSFSLSLVPVSLPLLPFCVSSTSSFLLPTPGPPGNC